MAPLMKMLIALIAIMMMFVANILILFSRSKLKGIFRWFVSSTAVLLVCVSFIFIVMVVFSI